MTIRPHNVIKFILIPITLYFLSWMMFSWPAILNVKTHLLTGWEDGLQHYWGLWWVSKAVTDLHVDYWVTHYLFYPFGVNLYAHALSPLNGLLVIPLIQVMPLFQAYNLLLISSFILSGFTVFWLYYSIYKRYLPALFAGFIFTFSPYHFAHGIEQIEKLVTYWIALYCLAFYKLMSHPSYTKAIIVAVLSRLLFLNSPYYVLYAFIISVITIFWWFLTHKNAQCFTLLRMLLITGILAFVLNANQIINMNTLSVTEPLLGGTQATENSLDTLGYFIPGRIWRWHERTEPISINKTSTINDRGSEYLGWSIIILLLIIGIKQLKGYHKPSLSLWWTLFGTITVLALGPILQISEHEYSMVKLPYAWIDNALPIIKTSGRPLHLLVISSLAASILGAAAWQLLW